MKESDIINTLAERRSQQENPGIGDDVSIGNATKELVVPEIENLSFTGPEDILYMAEYFGLSNEELIDASVTDKIRSIWEFVKDEDSWINSLSEIGIRVGGRMASGFLDKVYTYVDLIRRERDAIRKANVSSMERIIYERTTNR